MLMIQMHPYAEVADEGPLEVDEPPLQEVGNGDIPVGVVQEEQKAVISSIFPQQQWHK